MAPAGPVGWRSGCTTTRQVSAYSFPWDISPELMSKSVLPHVVLAAQISSISSPPAGILNLLECKNLFPNTTREQQINQMMIFATAFLTHRDVSYIVTVPLFQRGQVPLPGPARAAKCPDYHQQHNITTHQNLAGCAAFLLCSPGKDT